MDGSIPMKDGGIYCQIGGKPVVQILRETAPLAMAVIAIGSCASWGGIPSASPNPTGAVSVAEALGGKFTVINIPGCPPNPYNFLSTVLYVLTFKKLPDLDELEPAHVCLPPAHPRGLRAPGPFRRRPLRPGVRRRRPPPGLVPLQTGLQGAGDL